MTIPGIILFLGGCLLAIGWFVHSATKAAELCRIQFEAFTT